MSKMQNVPPTSLNDLPTRVHYLKDFLSFTAQDGANVQSAKPLIALHMRTILDAVYSNLLNYDITAKAFVPRQRDFSGEAPKSLADLSLDHPQIRYRQNFLQKYLERLVSNADWSDDSKFWQYLDTVGVMHTGLPGFKHREKRPELRVELVHMSALLGFVVDLVLKVVLENKDLAPSDKENVLRSFNKLIWIQNDLFARHYVVDRDSKSVPRGVTDETVNAPALGRNVELLVVAALAAAVSVVVMKLFAQ
ncbi:MAG: hypothetical protein M1819_006143 [Sarea resinae]|nr:MAG: hypothetical protein M1819_006143 [Sarea resinae]